MEKYDVIVVGAGPAGSTAARICALHNLKTLLLEKEKLPRKKPCAGGITIGALKELDFDLPENIVQRKCYGVYAEQGKLNNTVLFDSFIAIMTERTVFDAYLVKKAGQAGSIVKESEQCNEIDIQNDYVTVKTASNKYQADIVIGADGVFSRVRRAVRPPFTKNEMCYCLVTKVPLPDKEIIKRTRNMVELYYGYNTFGYAWAFPKKDYISFGIGGKCQDAKSLKRRFMEFLKYKHINTKNIKIKSCFLPISGFHHNIYTDRVMLAGDAAGLVDCFSGEGIRYALASGRLAAVTAVKAHNKKDFSKKVTREYQKMVYKRYKEDFICSRRVSWISFHFPNVIFGTPLRDKDIIQQYIRVLSGDFSFKFFALRVLKKLPGMLMKRFLLRQ